jgi:hypothetical protein
MPESTLFIHLKRWIMVYLAVLIPTIMTANTLPGPQTEPMLDQFFTETENLALPMFAVC